MNNLFKLVFISYLATSCLPQSEPVYVDTTQQNVNTQVIDNGNNNEVVLNDNNGNDDNNHDNGTGNQAPSTLPVDIIVSESNVSMELAQVKMVPIQVKADTYFEPGSIEVSVDYSSLLGFSINAGDYIQTTLNQTNFNLNSNGTVNLVLSIDVKSMAPSFKAKNNGGDGELIIRVTGVQGGQEMEKTFQINFEVKPQLTVGIISDAVPHGYDQANQIYTRQHSDGLQVVFQNKTMNFGLNGNGPCIHTTYPLQHCATNNRMEPGETYLPPKVFPTVGYRKAIFYNHFNSSDNISRYIHFNVAPGNEDG
jgi:hypothetical protein